MDKGKRSMGAGGGGSVKAERRTLNKNSNEHGSSGQNRGAPFSGKKSKQFNPVQTRGRRRPVRLAALDLGTNNCRLLIATPRGKEFRVIDAFSRIVRLGEGLSSSGVLSESAMERTIDALTVCAEKIERRGVTHMRCIATQACRGARNGVDFLREVTARTGLEFDIISTEEEARLAVAGCADLIDEEAEAGLIFDIGGGSTELSWVRRNADDGRVSIESWTSIPYGVVSIAEKWGGRQLDATTYAAIVDEMRGEIARIGDKSGMKDIFVEDRAHLLGTSGTVTSIAGVHLGLERYRRDLVDGLWLSIDDARRVTEKLRNMTFEERALEPCIGKERADLVVCGCAILEALQLEWPANRIRVADRGLREGVLADLVREASRRRR